MQEILEFVLKNITTMPDDVKIEVEEVEGTTNYIVTVNPVDVGRIIGKEGKVIKAIRTIMRVIAIQRGVHIRISVVSENDNKVDISGESKTSEPTAQAPITEEDGSITVEV
jgi:predicted RNA-binding protein YlqC (UPF0109 family)